MQNFGGTTKYIVYYYSFHKGLFRHAFRENHNILGLKYMVRLISYQPVFCLTNGKCKLSLWTFTRNAFCGFILFIPVICQISFRSVSLRR